MDVIYTPWPTQLALAATNAGAVVASGFAMLLHQAAAQVELMTGKPPRLSRSAPPARPSWPAASPRAAGATEAARAKRSNRASSGARLAPIWSAGPCR